MFEQEPIERRCSFPECKRPYYAKGLCRSHYQQQLLGRPLQAIRPRSSVRASCDFAGTIENLELWTRAQPSGQRAVDLLVWAEEIVARYGPERHLLSSRNRRGVEYADGYGEPIPRR
jgi:hypothetical protein